jgi:hypothetical protein
MINVILVKEAETPGRMGAPRFVLKNKAASVAPGQEATGAGELPPLNRIAKATECAARFASTHFT